MNKYFGVDEKVFDITERYPETIDVFAASGFEHLKNEAMRKIMGKTISLVMACKTKKINLDLFEQKLVEVIQQTRENIDSALNKSDKQSEGDVHMLGVLPCPVRIPLMESFSKWMGEHEKSLGTKVNYELKAANTGVQWIRDQIENATEDELADLFMSAGFDLFFDEKLMGRFKKQGVFSDISGFEKLNRDLDKIGRAHV